MLNKNKFHQPINISYLESCWAPEEPGGGTVLVDVDLQYG